MCSSPDYLFSGVNLSVPSTPFVVLLHTLSG
jgi:hypothetical protein